MRKYNEEVGSRKEALAAAAAELAKVQLLPPARSPPLICLRMAFKRVVSRQDACRELHVSQACLAACLKQTRRHDLGRGTVQAAAQTAEYAAGAAAMAAERHAHGAAELQARA